jgi:hypothetical protein
MTSAWMLFGNGNQFTTSPNMPPAFRSAIQNYIQNDNWVINNVYFVPDTNSYIILGVNVVFGSPGYPQDLFDTSWALFTSGNIPLYSSWYSAGCWAVFCSNGAYQLGPDVPTEVAATIQNFMLGNQQEGTRYWPYNLLFSPSGDWLLIGYDQLDEGNGTYNYSSNFPGDVLAAVNAIPNHYGAATVSFDPDGGWAMIDTAGNVYWGAATPADVQVAAQQFVSAGNQITSIQFAKIGVYTMPIQFSFSLTGPMQIDTWNNQSIGISYEYPNDSGQSVPVDSVLFGITTMTSGSSLAGQPLLSVASTSGLSVGQTITVNAAAGTAETAVIESIDPSASPTTLPSTLTLQANLQYSHQTGEAVSAFVPISANSVLNSSPILFPIAASTVVFPCNFNFTVTSAEEVPNYFGGNHAHFGVKFQQLLLDPQGNLLPDENGDIPAWQDVPGASAEVDLYGPNSTNSFGGPPAGATIAGPGESVQQTVMVPVNLANVQTALRFQFCCWLGDTNDDGPNSWDPGPMESIGGLQSGGIVFSEYPTDAADGDYANLCQLVILVIPSDLLQLKVMPVGLVYCPPGSASSATFSYGTTNSLTWGFSDSLGNSYIADNSSTFSLQNSDKGGVTFGFKSENYNISFGVNDGSQTEQSWDYGTSSGITSLVENAYTVTLTDVAGYTVTPTPSNPLPGDTASPSQQAFQTDTFMLLVRPQLAVWAYPGLNAVQLLGSWPGLYPAVVTDLAAAMVGTQGYPVTSSPPPGSNSSPILDANDCANLLSLDPFYVAQWQGAASLNGSRWSFIMQCIFGQEVQPFTVSNEVGYSLYTIVKSDTAYKQSASYTYSSSVESKYTYQSTQSNGIAFSVGGSVFGLGEGSMGGDSSSSTSAMSSSVAQGVKVGYQVSSGIDFQTATGYSGVLNDYSPSTIVTFNSDSGTTLLQVQSTNDFSSGEEIIVNPGHSTQEAATIQSIQLGIGFLLDQPLQNTHGNGEAVVCVWSKMLVNAFRDVLFGGIAFQDPSALRANPNPAFKLPKRGPISRFSLSTKKN